MVRRELPHAGQRTGGRVMGAPKKQAQEPQPLDTLDALQTQLRDVQDQIKVG